MSRQKKLIAKLKSGPNDFTYLELTALLKGLGYQKKATGKTGGSRRKFFHPGGATTIRLHKPHPGSIVKKGICREIQLTLEKDGLI